MRKIIVTDNSGCEHIFLEITGEIENHIDFNPSNDEEIKNTVLIATREFSDKKQTYETEVESSFLNPRRIDIVYGWSDA